MTEADESESQQGGDREKLLSEHHGSITDDDPEDGNFQYFPRHNLGRKVHAFTTALLAITVVVLLALLATRRTLETHRQVSMAPFDPFANDTELARQWHDCGEASDEARASGCKFDMMLSAWIHADCYDQELMEQYLSEGNYTWYRDNSFRQTISDAEVRLGNHEKIYSRVDFHYSHCAYVWEMQLRAYRTGKAIDLDVYNYLHTVHCANILVEHANPRNVTTLTVVFDKCGVPGAQRKL
jgi:hypothetical protein